METYKPTFSDWLLTGAMNLKGDTGQILNGAPDLTRTSTGFTQQAPQACASTNSATGALKPIFATPELVRGEIAYEKTAVASKLYYGFIETQNHKRG